HVETEVVRCRAITFTPNSRCIIVADDGAVTLYEAATSKVRRRYKLSTSAVATSPDGGFLAAGTTDGTVKLFDLRDAKDIASFEGDRGKVCSLTSSGDATTLLSGGAEGTILMWDLREVMKKAKKVDPLEAKAIDKLWEDLVDTDAQNAFHAVAVLTAT